MAASSSSRALDGLRGSANLQPHMIADLFSRPSRCCAPPVVIESISIGMPLSRRDASGYKFVTYAIAARCADGSTLRTERRYTDFVALHDQVQVALALPVVFPVPPTPSSLAWLSGEQPREIKLQQYLNQVVSAARRQPLPTLTAFCRMPPYVAVATSAEASLMSIPTAPASMCLAMLRAHPRDEVVASAGALRLLALARSEDEALSHSCLDTGSVEWLCAHLRQSTTVAKPSATLAYAFMSSSPFGLASSYLGRAAEPIAADAAAAARSERAAALSAGGGLSRAPSMGAVPMGPSGRLDSLRSTLVGRSGNFGASSTKLGASGKYSSAPGASRR